MSIFSLLLFAGTQHSGRNAEAIRAWIKTEKITAAAYRDLVRDWLARNYLTKEDAAALGAGS